MTSATTYSQALAKIGVAVPAHLIADAEIPVLSGPQRQGDLSIWPANNINYNIDASRLQPIPDSGIQVVVGEATGNTHWLHRGFNSPDVTWYRINDNSLRLAAMMVPEGQSAELIHTEEHGANAIGAGCYVIHGKRELADEIRRVAD